MKQTDVKQGLGVYLYNRNIMSLSGSRLNMGNALLYIAATSTYRTRVPPCVHIQCTIIKLISVELSLAQMSPTECGVSECNREASTMRRPWPTKGCRAK